MKKHFCFWLALAVLGCVSMDPGYYQKRVLTQTGLRESGNPELRGRYYEKLHNGYPLLFRAQAGEVWGRYGARLAMGEIGRELGGIASFLTGGRRHIDNVVGGPLDRLLARVIGQPISLLLILRHGKTGAPRLDILSDFSTVIPDDPQPHAAAIGFAAGSIYSRDAALVRHLMSDSRLLNRLKRYRSQYIRLDEQAVTFTFAGSETDFSAMIRAHESYEAFLLSIMDSLGAIADAV